MEEGGQDFMLVEVGPEESVAMASRKIHAVEAKKRGRVTTVRPFHETTWLAGQLNSYSALDSALPQYPWADRSSAGPP